METCYVEQGKMGKVFWLNVISTIRAKDYFTQFNIDPDYPVDREAGFLGVYLNYLFDEAESDIMSVKNNRIEK